MITDKYKLYWTPDSPEGSYINFWLSYQTSKDILIHSGPVSERHQAKIIYYLVTNLHLTIGEAKELWVSMIKSYGLPPFKDPHEYFSPAKSKFCICGHFLYEHTDSATPTTNNFGLVKLGCSKCGCQEFMQVVRNADSSQRARRG